MKKSGLTYGLTSLELFFWGPALCQSLSAGQNREQGSGVGPSCCSLQGQVPDRVRTGLPEWLLGPSGGPSCEPVLRKPPPSIPSAGSNEGIGWQPPGRPWAHTAGQKGRHQVAEATVHPPGHDALLFNQVDPV